MFTSEHTRPQTDNCLSRHTSLAHPYSRLLTENVGAPNGKVIALHSMIDTLKTKHL